MSENNSKSIDDLKKELYDMHKQFDNINIQKTLNENPNLIEEEKIKVKNEPIKKTKDPIPKKVIKLKKVLEETNNLRKIDTEAKEGTKIHENKKSDLETETSYLSIKEKLEKIKNEIEKSTLNSKAEENKKIEEKVAIKQVTPKVEKTIKPVDSFIKKKESNKNIEIIEKVNTNSKSNLLTIIILVLIIIMLVSIYLFVF